MAAELDVLKEIPGYKAILKSVLKSQIQMLMEQLSDQTGEESIILTASVHDGSLSHLGSSTGKGFLEGRDEIKAQFLGYCLKSQHTKESMEAETQQYSRSRTLMPPARRQRPRIRPAPYSISSPGSSTSVTSSPSFPMSSQHALNSMKHSDNMTIKPETANVADSFLDSVTGERDPEFPGGEDSGLTNQASNQNESFDSSQSSSQDDAGDTVQTVKLEPQENNDLELTGVELGDNSLSSDNWGQSYGSSTQHDGNQTDKNSYNGSEQTQKVATSHHNVHFGGIAFPGLDNAHHDFSSRTLPDMSPADLKQALYPQGNTLNHSSLDIDQFSPQQRKGSVYWCVVCNKSLQNRNLYEYHINAHAGVRPFECEICNRKFGSKQVLQTHQRLHSGERPFKCTKPGCDRSFTARSGLVYHMNKHHSE